MAVRSAGAGGVQILKRIDAEGMIDQRANAAGRGLRGGKRSDAGNLIPHCGAADGFFIVKGLAAEGRIDDEIDAAGFHQVDDIWPAFVGLIDGFCGYACRGERRGGAPGSQQSKAKLREVARQGENLAFVMVVHADEDGALARQFLSRGELRLRSESVV